MPPQANVTVTRVTGGGRGDDWDRPAAAGPQKWAGAARAYYRETTDRVTGGGRLDVFLRRELIVDTADVEAMDLDTDDVITWRVDGSSVDSVGKAKFIPRKKLAGIPRGLQTSKVVLTDA